LCHSTNIAKKYSHLFWKTIIINNLLFITREKMLEALLLQKTIGAVGSLRTIEEILRGEKKGLLPYS
jgi:hypothetical protein